MKYAVQIITAILIVFILGVAVLKQVGAQPVQPQMTPEQQDVVNLLQRESADAINRARQAELMVAKLQRELTACQSKKEEKK